MPETITEIERIIGLLKDNCTRKYGINQCKEFITEFNEKDLLRCTKAIEQYVQKRLYESNELKNEQSVIKARIEELKNISKNWKQPNVINFDERIAELKKGLK